MNADSLLKIRSLGQGILLDFIASDIDTVYATGERRDGEVCEPIDKRMQTLERRRMLQQSWAC